MISKLNRIKKNKLPIFILILFILRAVVYSILKSIFILIRWLSMNSEKFNISSNTIKLLNNCSSYQ